MVASAVGAEGGWGQLLCPLWGPQSSQDVDLPADSERRYSLRVAGEQPLSSTLCSPAPPSHKGGMLPLKTIVLSH